MDSKTFVAKWLEEDFDLLESEADPSYRHGSYMHEVYCDPLSGRYWQVGYTVSGDGEQHGIRDNEMFSAPLEVFPHEEVVTVVRYTATP